MQSIVAYTAQGEIRNIKRLNGILTPGFVSMGSGCDFRPITQETDPRRLPTSRIAKTAGITTIELLQDPSSFPIAVPEQLPPLVARLRGQKTPIFERPPGRCPFSTPVLQGLTYLRLTRSLGHPQHVSPLVSGLQNGPVTERSALFPEQTARPVRKAHRDI